MLGRLHLLTAGERRRQLLGLVLGSHSHGTGWERVEGGRRRVGSRLEGLQGNWMHRGRRGKQKERGRVCVLCQSVIIPHLSFEG